MTRPLSKALATRKQIKERIALIKRQIEETTSDYDREKLQERFAKLVWRRCGDPRWSCHRSGNEREKRPR